MLNIWILNNHYLMLNFETTQTVRRLQLVLESAGWNWKRCAIDDGHYQMVYIWLCNIMYIYIISYHIYILYYIIYVYIIYIISYIYILYYYIYIHITRTFRETTKVMSLANPSASWGFRQWRSSFRDEKSTNQAGFAHDVSENKVSCTLWLFNIAIENGHRNSEFSH